MKLEHVIKAYEKKGIDTILERMDSDNEKAGTIKYCDGICASYLLDNEDIIVCFKIFANCLATELTAIAQLEHTKMFLKIIYTTIDLLANLPKKEITMILKELGFFDGKINLNKKIKHLDHTYMIEIIDGVLCFTISEELNDGQ